MHGGKSLPSFYVNPASTKKSESIQAQTTVEWYKKGKVSNVP